MSLTKSKAKKLNKKATRTTSMTYRETKRVAVSLGMPFPDVLTGDWNSLESYIAKSKEKPNPELISQYDSWMDQKLADRGYDENHPMRHYQLRLAYISEDSMGKAPKLGSKPKKEKVAKPAREKDAAGLWKGTKKSYTFELANRGYSIERVSSRVIKKFPDANENSIKQWYKKALKIKEGNKS